MFAAPATRWTIAELDSLASIPWTAAQPTQFPQLPSPHSPEATQNKFWLDEGVVAVLTPGFLRGNSGSVTGGGASRRPDWPVSVPRLGVSAEHYGRLYRQVKHGIEPIMELNIRNRFTDQAQSFNIIAELRGSDLSDEVVMIGAHFDSWHLATGATDNAGQAAVMMEAMRILNSSRLPLRRTVRIALWTGEEQGLIGSQQYVKQHFGNNATPKLDHLKLYSYFNLDFGAGAIRGIFAQGNTQAAAIFREWLTAIDSDSISTRHISMESVAGSDHEIFDAAGLPAFAFIQDPIDYYSRTHHSSQDFFERLIPGDLRHNAIVIATFAYLAANRNEPMPRTNGLNKNGTRVRPH
jgi:carboxypeptidase Q